MCLINAKQTAHIDSMRFAPLTLYRSKIWTLDDVIQCPLFVSFAMMMIKPSNGLFC